MKAGQTAFQADNETYKNATKDACNLCCAWLAKNNHKQAAVELAKYLNAEDDTPTVAPPVLPSKDPLPAATLRQAARVLGYEGDPCPECQNFTLARNGTCLKCNTCGATTGCS